MQSLLLWGKTMDDLSSKLRTAIMHGAKTAGNEAVSFVVEQMEYGYDTQHKTYLHPDGKSKVWNGEYHTNIFDMGNLQQHVDYSVQQTVNGAKIEVGSPDEYAIYVHEGTQYLEGRPYLVDGIKNNLDRITAVIANQINRKLRQE